MCGIIGILSKDKLGSISAANESISHRGPDDSGIYVESPLALAHQRLSILDLSSKGHQPMHSNDGSLIIVYNGEIYNHHEIRKLLSNKYSFKSNSDTETILAGYQEFGPKLFSKLNGIFAFAIYDKSKKQLILCRDQFGIKPLYYYYKDRELFFGSEIKSFLKIPGWDKSLDHSALINYLHFLWSPGNQTPFQFIKKVLPGHFTIIDIDNPAPPQFQKYYEIPFTGKYENYEENEWINQLDKTFSTAVKRQMLSDVPIGFFLSGGLDSSIIVAKAREFSDKKIQCYTIDTDLNKNDKEGFTNDLQYAKKVADHLDVNLDIVSADVDIVRDFDKMIWHLDEPQADAAPLNVLNICTAARNNNNVVLLGGAGGDDLFSGYRRHQAINYEKYFNKTPSFINKGIHSITSKLPTQNPTLRRIKKLTKDIHKTQLERLAGYYQWLPLKRNKSLFSSDIMQLFNGYDPATILTNALDNIPGEKSVLNKLLFWDMKYFLTDHNLNYTDKLSMAAGVETRVPFLDLDLVALSAKMPVDIKMKGMETKYILKKMAEKYLPKEVIYRPKTGFGAPVRKWITTDLNDMISEYLSESQISKRGLFNFQNVKQLIQDNKNGKVDASYSIWGLLAIESWMKQFVDS